MITDSFYKIILFLFFSASAHIAQQIPELVTDRPDQTESATVVPVDFFQVESGFAYQVQKYTEGDDVFENNNLVLASTLCRYGVNRFIELRFGGEYFYGQSLLNGSKTNLQGIQNLLFGAKFQLRKDQKILTNVGIILQTIIPFGNESLKPANFSPVFLFCLEQQINEDYSFAINLGTESVDFSGNYSVLYSGSLSYSVTNKLGLFLELYGDAIRTALPSNNIDCGITYQFRPNLQVDFAIGTTLRGGITDLFGGFGLAVRLPE